MNDNPLKYQFIAEYRDGSLFAQNEEDVSLRDPKRSAFYDVEQERLRAFSLWGDGHAFLVDLTDGHFEIDQVRFTLHQPDEIDSAFNLVFFRRHRHEMQTQYTLDDQLVPQAGDTQMTDHRITFRLGWSALDKAGNVIERVMEFE